MKKIVRMLALGALVATMQGCGVAALVAAASMAGKNAETTRLEFQRLNMEREVAGLQPITWKDFKKGRIPGEPEPAEVATLGDDD